MNIMKNRYYSENKQYSLVSQVSAGIVTTMLRTLEETFRDRIASVFRNRATGVVKHYTGKDQRTCRFTVLFDAPPEYPDKAEEMILKTLEWTLTWCKSEYNRRAANTLEKEVKRLKAEYKEMKLDKKLV